MKIIVICVFTCFALAYAKPAKKVDKLVPGSPETAASILEVKKSPDVAKTEKRETKDLKVTGEASDSEKLDRTKKQATTFCVEIKPAPPPHIHVSCDGNHGGFPPGHPIPPQNLPPHNVLPPRPPVVVPAPPAASPPKQMVQCSKELVPYIYQPPSQLIYVTEERCRPVNQAAPGSSQTPQSNPQPTIQVQPNVQVPTGINILRPNGNSPTHKLPGTGHQGGQTQLACTCHHVLIPAAGTQTSTGVTNAQLAAGFLEALQKNNQNNAQGLAQILNPPQARTAPQLIHKPDCPVHNVPQVQFQPQFAPLYRQASPSALQQTDDCFGQTVQGQRIGRVPDQADLQREKDKLVQQRQIAESTSVDGKKVDKPDIPSQIMDQMKAKAGVNPVARSTDTNGSDPLKNIQNHQAGKPTYFRPSKPGDKPE